MKELIEVGLTRKIRKKKRECKENFNNNEKKKKQ